MKQIKFKTSKGEFVVCDNGKGIQLSKITEEQSKEIVFRIGHHSNEHLIPSALELLYSLLESKGITELNNKYIFKL